VRTRSSRATQLCALFLRPHPLKRFAGRRRAPSAWRPPL
jgi:hypothetical protein